MDDDIPFADPQIQRDYEMALGQFLVAFNAIENIISDILVRALGKASLHNASLRTLGEALAAERFDNRLRYLRLIAADDVNSPPLFDEVKRLAESRNHLAHGHFDQNPFSGDFVVSTPRRTRSDISSSMIEKLARDADQAFQRLRHVEVQYIFDDLTEDELET